MKNFYGREEESKKLLEIYSQSQKRARFTYILGQRRVGKTTLIKQVFFNSKLESKNLIFYFFVGRKTPDSLLTEFKKILSEKLDYVAEFNSLEGFFSFIFNLSKQKHLTIIFDEFQNFTYVDDSSFSSLQKIWDQEKETARINLIAIGSIYSSMEKIFSSKHEPLFGRPTDKFHISPLPVKTVRDILLDKKITDLNKFLSLWTIFGGIPKYYELIEIQNLFKKQTSQIFYKLFLETGAALKGEGLNLLIEEFGPNYQRYFSILEALAIFSKASNSKIANHTGISPNHINTYISKLEKTFKIIEKEVPIINQNRKIGRYKIKDHLLNTWFKYIFANKGLVESGQNKVVLTEFKNTFRILQGYSFENLVKNLLKTNYKNYPYKEWGKYWDKNREIDIVGINRQSKQVLLGECKLQLTNKTLTNVANKLTKNKKFVASLLPGYEIKTYVFVLTELKNKKLKLEKNLEVQIISTEELLN